MSRMLAAYLSVGYKWILMLISIAIFTWILKGGFSWGRVGLATGISLALCLFVAIPIEIYVWREFHLLGFIEARVEMLKQQWQATKQAWKERKKN